MSKDNFGMGDVALNHIGIVVKDIEATSKILSLLFNIGPWSTFTYNATSDLMIVGEPFVLKCSSAKLGPTMVELLEPIDSPNSVWGQVLATKGEGVHHIAFRLKNFSAKTKELEAQGWKKLVHAKEQDQGKEWCYMAKDGEGIVFDLMDDFGL